jgi:hypothetical protein
VQSRLIPSLLIAFLSSFAHTTSCSAEQQRTAVAAEWPIDLIGQGAFGNEWVYLAAVSPDGRRIAFRGAQGL